MAHSIRPHAPSQLDLRDRRNLVRFALGMLTEVGAVLALVLVGVAVTLLVRALW